MVILKEDLIQKEFDDFKQKVKDELEGLTDSANMKYANGDYMNSLDSRSAILTTQVILKDRIFGDEE